MTDSSNRTPDAAEWDERYGAAEQVWSGEPNGALVAEVAGLPPGRALDVGCGEGADAVWLARRGWRVTGVDVSGVALERARRHAGAAGVDVDWVHAGLLEAGLPSGAFDLVSAHYPVLHKTPDARGERALLDLVAPGGTLLVVHHHIEHEPHDHEPHDHVPHDHEHGGFDPALYVLPGDVAAVLSDDWVVEVDERRRRVISGGAGAHHADDLVLRARRR